MTGPSITEFLLARIAEDEEDAPYKSRWVDGCGMIPDDERALAECAAKRAMIDLCRADHEDSTSNGDDTTELSTEILETLAAVYATHPDYRQEWAL